MAHSRKLQSRQQRGGQDHTTHPARTKEKSIRKLQLIFSDRAKPGVTTYSFTVLAACRLVKEATGIKVVRVDFSDPQSDKVPCDRRAETIKAHVFRYINKGHDVVSANDLKRATLSHGGDRGVRVTLIYSTTQHPISLQGKLERVSKLNKFHYGEEYLTAWKAFDVGEGKAIPWSQLQGRNISCAYFFQVLIFFAPLLTE